MNYTVTIDKFEGPLDLLLHLIKESDIDIFDIKISEITNQYLLYISQMETLNLNIDSEYLTMAADLIEIKSKELLPRNEEEEEEEDPREELINRLIEYQKYKEISETFKNLEEERKELFTKDPSLLNEYRENGIKISEDITLDDLINAFLEMQKRVNFKKPVITKVARKEYSIKDKINKIRSLLIIQVIIPMLKNILNLMK